MTSFQSHLVKLRPIHLSVTTKRSESARWSLSRTAKACSVKADPLLKISCCVKRQRAYGQWRVRCHFNYDFRFNSQSTAALLTVQPTIGGCAWPSLSFRDPRHEAAFVLWADSTLGLLIYWWRASKQQSGRGSITLTRLPDLPTFDFRTLSDERLGEAARCFDALKALTSLAVRSDRHRRPTA